MVFQGANNTESGIFSSFLKLFCYCVQILIIYVLKIPCSVKKKHLRKMFIAGLIMPSLVYVTLSEAETIAAL